MKRIILLLLSVVILIASFTGCDMLPEDIKTKIDGALDGIFHKHDFVYDRTTEATCTLPEKQYFICSCGEEKVEEVKSAYGHEYVFYSDSASCAIDGKVTYKCKYGDDTYSEPSSAKGHSFPEATEASRLIACENKRCSYGYLPEGNNKHKEVLTFKLNEDDKTRIQAIRDELSALIEAAAPYDPELHGYSEVGEIADEYAKLIEVYGKLEEELIYVISQYQISEIHYYVDMENEENESRYYDTFDYYNAFFSEFYSHAEPIYNSMYRDFYYYGMTEEEIQDYIRDCNGVSTPEYLDISDKISEIEEAYHALEDVASDESLPALYAEFVSLKNELAKVLGYDNYLKYAYVEEYSRDYSYTEVEAVVDYAKTYIIPCYNLLYKKYMTIGRNMSESDYYASIDILYNSFFSNVTSNKYLNDFIDTLVFADAGNGEITFSDELNKLMADGNLFRGSYEGAFTTSIRDAKLPIAYFGSGYENAFTVAHEFGHFMNEIYNRGEYSQSYDLLEMHSQGTELLYLAYLADQVGKDSDIYGLVKSITLLNTMSTVLHGLSVDSFENAVYLNEYDGYGSDVIMADGTITPDEYDKLFTFICIDLGLESPPLNPDNMTYNSYWRYVVIESPCYYVSYSMSALSVLGLYSKTVDHSLDEVTEMYYKLFTYTDVDPEMTPEEVMDYAGLYAYTSEELFKNISKCINN